MGRKSSKTNNMTLKEFILDKHERTNLKPLPKYSKFYTRADVERVMEDYHKAKVNELTEFQLELLLQERQHQNNMKFRPR